MFMSMSRPNPRINYWHHKVIPEQGKPISKANKSLKVFIAYSSVTFEWVTPVSSLSDTRYTCQPRVQLNLGVSQLSSILPSICPVRRMSSSWKCRCVISYCQHVLNSLIVFTLKMETSHSSKTPVQQEPQSDNAEDNIFHSHRHKNLNSYVRLVCSSKYAMTRSSRFSEFHANLSL
jgi:hypothetical protein